MSLAFFTKGVDWKNPRLTKKPRVWGEYLCWCIHAWMTGHIPYYPRWLRRYLLSRFPARRHGIMWWQVRYWQKHLSEYVFSKADRPLPWYIGPRAIGPFVRPWRWIARQFRGHTSGRSHRCEFTDREEGALYGGQKGGFMDDLFEELIRNISDPAENAKWN